MRTLWTIVALAGTGCVWGDVYRPAGVTVEAGKTLEGQGAELLHDGKMNPACAFVWEKGKEVVFTLDLGGVKPVRGVKFLTPRSWVNCSVQRASYAGSADGTNWVALKKGEPYRPGNTYAVRFSVWEERSLRYLKVTVHDTYDFKPNYYSFYTHEATKRIAGMFETPPYNEFSGARPTVQIAEIACFNGTPDDLPLPNRDGATAYPEARLERDWLYQDAATSNVSHVANVTADTTKPDALGRDISALVDGRGLPDAAWRAAHAARRRTFLEPFRAKAPRFIYVKHIVMGNSILHATDDLTDATFQEWRGVPDYTEGGSQLVLAEIRADGSVAQEVLLEEPRGIIRDPAVSFDAKSVVFAKRGNLTTENYHLWRLDLETRRLTQLTRDGLYPCSDIEPCFLPDGSIVFQSTRCGHSVDCWPLPVSNLHRCDADGRHIRRLGFDQVQTFYPQLLDDGRVAFTRWEYNDRNAAMEQQLYAMNPNGERQTGLFANNSEWPVSLLHARGVPGTGKLMAISSGHHVGQKGRLVEADPGAGDDYTSFTYDPAKALYGMDTNAIVMNFPGNRKLTIPWSPWDGPSAALVTNLPGLFYLAGAAMDAAPGRTPAKQPRGYHYNVYDMHTQFGPQWAYPFPLDGERLLVSYMPEGCRYYRGPYSSRFGIYALRTDGARELLAFDWGQHCMQPVALVPRAPRPRPMRKLDYADGWGTYYVQNVYEGAAMKGAPKGCVKRIRVIGLEYRPVHIGWNWQMGWHSTQGKIGTPISVGNGAYDVKHILGEADVEADGSASFRAPARTPLYFQLIDARGCCVQTMRSWSTLMPGEVNGCVGCHEHPHRSALDSAKALALRKPPQELKPWRAGAGEHPFLVRLRAAGPLADLDAFMGLNRPKKIDRDDAGDGFAFRREVQPILTAKCAGCHDGSGARAPAAMDLRDADGALPPTDDQSHRAYSAAYLALSYRGLCNDKINFAHGLAFAPFQEPYHFGSAKSGVWRMFADGRHAAKLTDAELRTLAAWIDLCVPFCGSYVERNAWGEEHRRRYNYAVNKRAAFAWEELNDIRAEKGLDPVPMTFTPDAPPPRRQRTWHE